MMDHPIQIRNYLRQQSYLNYHICPLLAHQLVPIQNLHPSSSLLFLIYLGVPVNNYEQQHVQNLLHGPQHMQPTIRLIPPFSFVYLIPRMMTRKFSFARCILTSTYAPLGITILFLLLYLTIPYFFHLFCNRIAVSLLL